MNGALPLSPTSAPDDREELARAEIYGVLAALFQGTPDGDLYERLQTAPTQADPAATALESSWAELVAASRRLALAEVQAEYAALFQGVGKPELLLQASYHVSGSLNAQPLVELRDALDALGLERAAGVEETEDHIAGLCEVMRYLIAGDDLAVSNLARQQRFFNDHVRHWVESLCTAIADHPRSDFYRACALFARDFFEVEAQGFDLLEA